MNKGEKKETTEGIRESNQESIEKASECSEKKKASNNWGY